MVHICIDTRVFSLDRLPRCIHVMLLISSIYVIYGIYIYIFILFFSSRLDIFNSLSHLCFIDVLHTKLSERLRHSVKLRRFVVYMFVAHEENKRK